VSRVPVAETSDCTVFGEAGEVARTVCDVDVGCDETEELAGQVSYMLMIADFDSRLIWTTYLFIAVAFSDSGLSDSTTAQPGKARKHAASLLR